MRYKLHQAKKCESLTPSSTGNRSHCQSHVSVKTHGCIAHLTSHRIHSISFTLSSLPQRANKRCQKKERKKNASSFPKKNNQIHTQKKITLDSSQVYMCTHIVDLFTKKVTDSRRSTGQINTNSLVR